MTTTTSSEPNDWATVRIQSIVKATEARKRKGEEKRQIFRGKIEELRERYERVMERRIQRLREDGMDITLEEFRARPSRRDRKKAVTVEEEEYRNIFGQGASGSGNQEEDAEGGGQELFGESDSDSDREVVDYESYGISNPPEVKTEIKELDLSILRPARSGFGNLLNIIRPVMTEPTVEELEPTELEPITEGVSQAAVKTIKLKMKPKKHHTKPKPTRTNSQANLRKVFGSDSGDDKASTKGNSAFLETFLRQNSSGHLIPSDTKEKFRLSSAKLKVIKAFRDGHSSETKKSGEVSVESDTKQKLAKRSESTDSMSIATKGLLKRRESSKQFLMNKHK